MTAIYLITGFLGSGKTTFLKRRLEMTTVRTGVLVNDFGKINFDGLQIQHDGLEMVELSNGSIFCSCLKDSFIDGLVHLVDLELDQIFIESSGLADPSDMGKILDVVRLRTKPNSFNFNGTICLIDCLFFPKVLPKMLAVERQIRHSHLIILNKLDLVEPAQVKIIRNTIGQMNPLAAVIETSYGFINSQHLAFEIFPIEDEESTNKITTRNKNLILHFLHEPEEQVLREFLTALGSHFFRIKGLIQLNNQTFKIDQVNDQLQMNRYDARPAIDPSLIAAAELDPHAGAESWNAKNNQLVCLTSQGLESISHLSTQIERFIPGYCRLEM
ncbi:MAG: GTP-binding protein [Eubacteriales bacterium]|nr:GTP-binding protein [Eubacteriales bacterium]